MLYDSVIVIVIVIVINSFESYSFRFGKGIYLRIYPFISDIKNLIFWQLKTKNIQHKAR